MSFVAGWLGSAAQWREYSSKWKAALAPRTSLHMVKLRLGTAKGQSRNKDLLKRLGSVPSECGLIPIAGSVWRGGFYRARLGHSP